jgi:hypothetical protein
VVPGAAPPGNPDASAIDTQVVRNAQPPEGESGTTTDPIDADAEKNVTPPGGPVNKTDVDPTVFKIIKNAPPPGE